jgi:hypothetical protein
MTKGISEGTLAMNTPGNLVVTNAIPRANRTCSDRFVDESVGLIDEDFHSHSSLAYGSRARKPVVSRLVEKEWRSLDLQSDDRAKTP